MHQWGPWERVELLDRWLRDRWRSRLGRAVEDFWHRGAGLRFLLWLGRNPYRGGTRWLHPWQPRTCSFCGGAHPEDALRLLEEGWESEGTGKSYKRYLNPPGYGDHVARCVAAVRGGQPTAPLEAGHWSPTPPVKVYLQHWNQEQCARANALIERRTGGVN
jgi:hypothetical protein